MTPGAPASDPVSPVIDYDELFERYLRSLVDTLRGFSSGIEGLEFWVPSEDPQVSLGHMLEAAAAEGRQGISVRFGKQSAPRLERRVVEQLIAAFGRGRVTHRPEELLVEVTDLHARVPEARPDDGATGRPARARPVGPGGPAPVAAPARAPAEASDAPYAAALARAVGSITREGEAPELRTDPPGATVRVESRWQGTRLMLDIEVRSHLIREARFAGAAGAQERSLMDRFCTLLPGLPVLEAAQHGVIQLEYRLRDRDAPPPVAGVVTPTAAHPMFQLPEQLIRDALELYRGRTGYQETDNRHDPGPGAAWRAASATQRRAWLEVVLADCRARAGSGPGPAGGRGRSSTTCAWCWRSTPSSRASTSGTPC